MRNTLSFLDFLREGFGDQEHFWTHGACDTFAVALSRRFGWTVLVYGDRFRHTFCQTPSGRLMDASGEITPDDLAERYGRLFGRTMQSAIHPNTDTPIDPDARTLADADTFIERHLARFVGK